MISEVDYRLFSSGFFHAKKERSRSFVTDGRREKMPERDIRNEKNHFKTVSKNKGLRSYLCKADGVSHEAERRRSICLTRSSLNNFMRQVGGLDVHKRNVFDTHWRALFLSDNKYVIKMNPGDYARVHLHCSLGDSTFHPTGKWRNFRTWNGSAPQCESS